MSPLSEQQLKYLNAFSKSCRRSILQMVTNAQSGHPGGSLSSLDFLALLYVERISKTNEPVVVSHGHISPAVYAVLAELGVIPKDKVIEGFRRPDDIYEGHVNRAVKGIWYGTGPLGVGASVAAGFAVADKIRSGIDASQKVFLLMGDGEQDEGQIYETMNFASGHKLNNLIAFIDYNRVQLTDSLAKIMPINIEGHYKSAGWKVFKVNGHNFQEMWAALEEAMLVEDAPCVIIGETIMGKGVEFMEASGREHKADWHGKAASAEQSEAALKLIELSDEDLEILKNAPQNEINGNTSEEVRINTGMPILYGPEKMTDCRSAYGNALADLAKLNPEIVALTADLADSVKTSELKKIFPERHIECGIAEQFMISAAGGISLRGLVPFASTFGAFMTSRAKDQARVNDVNETNVKMVATHCGLSVGEDGPTHQVLDDINSFEGFFNTQIFEPCDPNQTDKIIRYVASNYGNFYVRMGRAKTPVILKEDGTAFFGEGYEFSPGKADIIRHGSKATLVASGAMLTYAMKAAEEYGGDVEIICVSSFLPFDSMTVVASAKKTGKVITVQDHNLKTGLAKFVKEALFDADVIVPFKGLGVTSYQLSGTADELYEKAGISTRHILEALKSLN